MIRAVVAAILFAFCAPSAFATDIQAYGRGDLAAIRSNHAGRFLVVHYWSLTCLPCMVEMPRLASFARERPDIDFVFVAADPHEQSERIAARLARFGLSDATHYAFADAFVERLRFEADKTWQGELPFTLLIAPDGKTRTHLGEIDPPTLQRWRADGG